MSGAVLAIVAASGLLMIVVLAWLSVRQLRLFTVRVKSESVDRAAVRRKMAEVERLLLAPSQMARAVAVAEADKLLDYVLKEQGAIGETAMDRLASVVRAHRDLRAVVTVKDRLSGASKPQWTESEAAEAVRKYRRALKVLGAL